jgi:hypothetical protein
MRDSPTKIANIIGNIWMGILDLLKFMEEVKNVFIQFTLLITMSFCPLSSASMEKAYRII